jgi:TRAP-type C4-dicarboxylate transport system permease small subunit
MSHSRHPVRAAWHRAAAAYGRFLNGLLMLSVAIIVFPVTLQIVSRWTDALPHYIWTEEMARFLFIWMIMIGAMVGVREGTHFEVDLFPVMSPKVTAALRLVGSIAILVFALIFLWAGIEFTRFAFNRTSELAELPLWLIHVAWPVTGATWILFLGERMADDFDILRGRKVAIGTAGSAS